MGITNIRCFVLMMIIAIVLTGCSGGGVTTPLNDEAKVKSVINEYYLALSNLNFNKAKNYCVYGSDQYYAVSQVKALVDNAYLYCNTITFNAFIDIQNVSVSGNYATVSGYTTFLLTYCGYYYNDEMYSNFNLQKVGNSWKLY